MIDNCADLLIRIDTMLIVKIIIIWLLVTLDIYADNLL